VLDNCAHIEQVSVAPSHARRGVGGALIEHLATIAPGEGRRALTLTTFRDCRGTLPTTSDWDSGSSSRATRSPSSRASLHARHAPSRVVLRESPCDDPHGLGSGDCAVPLTSAFRCSRDRLRVERAVGAAGFSWQLLLSLTQCLDSTGTPNGGRR
jgi:hypothetical protein